eukprot:gene10770-7497_t
MSGRTAHSWELSPVDGSTRSSATLVIRKAKERGKHSFGLIASEEKTERGGGGSSKKEGGSTLAGRYKGGFQYFSSMKGRLSSAACSCYFFFFLFSFSRWIYRIGAREEREHRK